MALAAVAVPSPSYAGSKCYEPPTPKSLPRPPTAWVGQQPQQLQGEDKASPFQNLVNSMLRESGEPRDTRPQQQQLQDKEDAVSQHLKFLLKVQQV